MADVPPRPERQIPPRGLGDILAGAFQMYTKNWAMLLQVAAIVVVPLTLLEYFLSDFLIRRTVTVTLANGVVTTHLTAWRQLVAELVVTVAVVIIANVLTGAMMRAAATDLVGKQPTLGEVYRFGFARFASVLWVSFLCGISIMVGFILLVIPGFFLIGALAAAIPVLVVEDVRGTKALSRSWELVRGHWWHVFGTMVVVALITGLINSILTTPFHNWFLRAIMASIGSVITIPFWALVIALIYLDLRARKQPLDLLLHGLALAEPCP
jgi:hypothetical protein